MALRIALGGIVHETNTYCRDQTELDSFQVFREDGIVEEFRGYRTDAGGMIAAAEDLGAELVPTIVAVALPSGTISGDTYADLKEELLLRIEAALPVDAVAMPLHGAGVAEGVDDLEADLCWAVRDLVGPAVPIVLSLDIHGNITQRVAGAVNAMFGDNYYPEVDAYDRGREAIALVPRILSGEVHPVIHVEKLPMLVVTSTTDLYPASAALELCHEVERQPGMIDCTFFHGFPYTDIPDVGASVVATADGDRALATSAARSVASWVWGHREDFRPETLSPEEAVARALATEAGPVVINDTADNPGGGTPGDGTHLLRAMLDAGLDSACFGFIYDPEVVDVAHAAGVGATLDVALGGKSDELHGGPIQVRAYVKSLSDGQFFMPSWGSKMDLKKMARLQVNGMDILVGSDRQQTFDPDLFLLNGIDVRRYKIVALKSSQHFRAGFAPVAAAIITADSPGMTTRDVANLPRRRAVRPMWPLDEQAHYGEESQ